MADMMLATFLSTYRKLFKLVEDDRFEELRFYLDNPSDALSSSYQDQLLYDLLKTSLYRNRKIIAMYILVDLNSLVDSPKYKNETPLHIALFELRDNDEYLEIVVELLSAGARVTTQASSITPIHVAFRARLDEMLLDILLEKSREETSENLMDLLNLSLLHIACTRPNLEIVKHYIDGGANVNEQMLETDPYVRPGLAMDYAKYTPLHFAVLNGHVHVAGLLVESGADVHLADVYGSTPVHLSCKQRDVRMVEFLLPHVKSVDSADDSGLTLFMAACMGSDADVVLKFLDSKNESLGKDDDFARNMVNAQVTQAEDHPFAGYTPLHFAVEFERTATVEILLRAGADVQKKDANGLSAVELAAKKGCEDIFKESPVHENGNAQSKMDQENRKRKQRDDVDNQETDKTEGTVLETQKRIRATVP